MAAILDEPPSVVIGTNVCFSGEKKKLASSYAFWMRCVATREVTCLTSRILAISTLMVWAVTGSSPPVGES